ncbi:MAG: aminopeptidase P family protein [Lachnospiraceae bacterium]|nr:aminopeptidase P family protein [Lachnospiraceae bacterium]
MAAEAVRARITALRALMEESGIDWFLIPTEDYHRSEYVADFFKTREFFSGFTGSAGTLLVGRTEAALWADGRYFVQAERELQGSGIALMKMQEPGVPTILGFLKEKVPAGGVLAFDGRCISAAQAEEYKKALEGRGAALRTDLDPADGIWTDRPSMPSSPVFILDTEYTGESASEKLARLRGAMAEKECTAFFTGRLDEIMWLFNIRGGDVECNPVALSYAFCGEKDQYLFLQESEKTPALDEYCRENGITVLPYESVADFLREYPYAGNVLCDPAQTGSLAYGIIKDALAGRSCGRIVDHRSPLEDFKAVKNDTEMRHLRACYKADSAAVCRFIKEVTSRVAKGEKLTEMGAADIMDGKRREIADYLDLSFETISAYGPNAAMMHYSATPENNSPLAPEGMLLVDSGGQYKSGTTDVTRTFALGPVTEAMRRHYTLTAESNLQLLDAVFMDGCCGANLDILARGPLWKAGIDYKCGTGHGIGFVLNVHETPPSIRWRFGGGGESRPLAPGMIVSDEPGVYLEGQYGIRIETILEVREKTVNSDGRFLCFAPLTLVPLDRALLDPEVLTSSGREILNRYHELVRREIGPLLFGEDAKWLQEQTEPL